jgi:hypothetical protein
MTLTKLDHNILINQAVRSALRPIGCTQKGRSRTWLDDHHWWVTVIEFQPSSWSKGTYLNVGACWLWNTKDYLSFDDGYRVDSFVSAENLESFESAVEAIAARAREEVLQFRHRFPTVRTVAGYLKSKETRSEDIWSHYHAGVSCGLAGWSSESERRLRAALAVEERDAEWVHNLKAECGRLLPLVSNAPAFRSHVLDVISASREALKLKPATEFAFDEL